MKIDVMFLVTRLNNEIINVTPINEIYTYASISLKSEYLSDDDIRKFYSFMGKGYAELKINDIRKIGNIYMEQEAKDLTCELSQYSVRIEHKEIEFS